MGSVSIGLNHKLVSIWQLRDGFELVANWGIPLNLVKCDALSVVQGIESSSTSKANAFICLDIKSLMSQVNCVTC